MSLDALEDWASSLLNRLTPSARQQLFRRLARDLRKGQQARIQAQRNPDGSPYERRKPKPHLRDRKGRIKRQMFTKLRLARHLKVTASDTTLTVGFGDRASRIARVHQLGLHDRPAPGQAQVAYPVRQLLGLTEAELDQVRDALIGHLCL
jgi:phage virion morphogenesis protein